MCSKDFEEVSAQIAGLKNALFQDKVYAGLQLLALRDPSKNLQLPLSELRIFSQNGEDGVLQALLGLSTKTQKYFVEFGAGDGWSNNCRLLAEVFGWKGLFIEGDSNSFKMLKEHYRRSTEVQCLELHLEPENINQVFSDALVPHDFGVLSIDVDGQDFWLWQALDSRWQPSIVIIEYNSALSGRVVEELGSTGALSGNYGASLQAVCELARNKNYQLVYTEMAGVNAFFCRSDLLALVPNDNPPPVERSPNYGLRGQGHDARTLFPNGDPVSRRLVDPFSK